MSSYIGKEMYEFHFKNESYIDYNSQYMDDFIGKVGKIIDQIPNMVAVKFEGNIDTWHYPTHLIDEHLVENDLPIDLNELFNQIKQL